MPFLLSEGVCIYNKISALFDYQYQCHTFLDGIIPLNITFVKILKITISTLGLHAASSIRIPNFMVRKRPLNLFSASSVDLHGAYDTNVFFRNNQHVRKSPIKTPV